jgi:hypothetical protein
VQSRVVEQHEEESDEEEEEGGMFSDSFRVALQEAMVRRKEEEAA